MIERIILYYQNYPTVGYATAALLLIALCAALLGTPLVLRRYSMIGDGLSHVSFGAACVATAMGLTTPTYIALPVTVVAAVILLKISSSRKVNGDAAIAMVSAGSLAIGYLSLNLIPDNSSLSTDACADLFGSGIIGIGWQDLVLCLVLAAVCVAVFCIFYNKIFAVTFDSDFAASAGVRVGLYNTLVAIITGVTVVISMSMVGALIISAFIIFPALSAMRLFRSFKSVTVASAIISLSSALIGILISLVTSTPTSSTVVIVELVVFAVCFIVGKIKK